MKKYYLFCLLSMLAFTSVLAEHVDVSVDDFTFSPASFTIKTGDTVNWVWVNTAGAHTTTSTNIPAGAASWNQVIGSASPSFSYIATVPGSYSYICLYHVSMGMAGMFNVIGSTGVPLLSPNDISLDF